MKSVRLEFAKAYPVPHLVSAQRHLWLPAEGQGWTAHLHDASRFDGFPGEVEEAFVTWLAVEVGEV